MSCLGLVLIGFALADLGHSLRPTKWLPESIAAGAVLVIGLVLGVGWPVVVIGLVVFAWGPIVRFGFGHGRAQWTLGYFAGVVALALALSDLGGSAVDPTIWLCTPLPIGASAVGWPWPGAVEHWQRRRTACAGEHRVDEPNQVGHVAS